MTTKDELPAEYRIGQEHFEPQTALEIVENFEILVSRERLLRGVYMSSPHQEMDFGDGWKTQALKDCGAMCGGARACAMGTLHLATGRAWKRWPGSSQFNVMGREPGPLGEAMAALDQAAIDYANENGLSHHVSSMNGVGAAFDTHQLEELFENPSDDELEDLPETPSKITDSSTAMTGVMLEVARRAKELLET
jgi:hypothetical protein